MTSDKPELAAVDYIQEYIQGDQLQIIVDNRNCDLILHHLTTFLNQLNSEYKEDYELVDQTARKLKSIEIKFVQSLYHKIYKEEMFKVILQNSKIVNKHTKLREIRVYETVLSNKDFFLLGQIIGCNT